LSGAAQREGLTPTRSAGAEVLLGRRLGGSALVRWGAQGCWMVMQKKGAQRRPCRATDCPCE
jgi:hypothetical protein